MALDFAAGCLGGCAGIIVGHPFDTVKVHLQTQDFRNPMYRGTFDCIKQIVARDTMRGLYRGMSSPMAGVAFVNAIVFGVYGNVQRSSSDPNSLYSHFLAGSVAGLVQSVVCSPMELAKTRIQLQNNLSHSAVKFKGPLDCMHHIWRREGTRGVFRGLGITAARDLPGFSSYFVSYELMIRTIPNPSAIHILLAGGLAGTFSWMLTFPIDVVKSRLQADGMSGKRQYSGIADCIKQSYAAEGLSFLSRGVASTLMRAFPMNAVCFLVVSWTLKLFEKSNIDLEIKPVEPLLMVGASSPRKPSKSMIVKHKHEHDNHTTNIKLNTYNCLRFLGAFSEAVCCSEMNELAHDLHQSEDGGYYYLKFNEFLFNSEEGTSMDHLPLLLD